ncbi:hypothetical protein CCP3SC1AL1_3990001 [Gammaproteobacteria bacterium]
MLFTASNFLFDIDTLFFVKTLEIGLESLIAHFGEQYLSVVFLFMKFSSQTLHL